MYVSLQGTVYSWLPGQGHFQMPQKPTINTPNGFFLTYLDSYKQYITKNQNHLNVELSNQFSLRYTFRTISADLSRQFLPLPLLPNNLLLSFQRNPHLVRNRFLSLPSQEQGFNKTGGK